MMTSNRGRHRALFDTASVLPAALQADRPSTPVDGNQSSSDSGSANDAMESDNVAPAAVTAAAPIVQLTPPNSAAAFSAQILERQATKRRNVLPHRFSAILTSLLIFFS